MSAIFAPVAEDVAAPIDGEMPGDRAPMLAASAILFVAAPVLGTLPMIPGGVPALTGLAAVLLFASTRRSTAVFGFANFLIAGMVFVLLGTHTLLMSKSSTFANTSELAVRIAILVPIFLLAGVVIGRAESRVIDRTVGTTLAVIGLLSSATIWFSETTFGAHRVTMGRFVAVAFVIVALSPVRLAIRVPASMLLFLGLLSSGSRGAFLFGALAVGTIALFKQGLSSQKLFAILLGVFVLVQQFSGRLFDIQETIAAVLGSRSGDQAENIAFRQAQSLNLREMLASPSSAVRTDETFSLAVDQFWEHPFTGVGLASGVSPRRESYVYAHNFLLESASALGILGVIGSVGVLIYLFRYLWLDRTAMPAFAGLVIFAVMSSLVSGNVAINRELWLILGVAFSRMRELHIGSEPPEDPEPRPSSHRAAGPLTSAETTITFSP